MRFILAAGYIGGGSALLAIILFVVALLEHQREKNVTSYALLLCACLAFCFGAFLAYKNKDAEVEKLRKQGATPLIVINPPSLWWGSTNHGDLMIIVDTSIENPLGPPTALKSWGLLLERNGEQAISGEMPILPPNDEVIALAKEGPLTLPRNRNFTQSGTIEAGGISIGWLKFVFPGITKDTFEAKSSSLTLSCVDVASNNRHATSTRIDLAGGLYIPGVGQVS